MLIGGIAGPVGILLFYVLFVPPLGHATVVCIFFAIGYISNRKIKATNPRGSIFYFYLFFAMCVVIVYTFYNLINIFSLEIQSPKIPITHIEIAFIDTKKEVQPEDFLFSGTAKAAYQVDRLFPRGVTASQRGSTVQGISLANAQECRNDYYRLRKAQDYGRFDVCVVDVVLKWSDLPSESLIVYDESHFWLRDTLMGVAPIGRDGVIAPPLARYKRQGGDNKDREFLSGIFGREFLGAQKYRQLLSLDEVAERTQRAASDGIPVILSSVFGLIDIRNSPRSPQIPTSDLIAFANKLCKYDKIVDKEGNKYVTLTYAQCYARFEKEVLGRTLDLTLPAQ